MRGLLTAVDHAGATAIPAAAKEQSRFAAVEAVGRATSSTGRDLFAFVTMLGALGDALLRVLRDPRRLRPTSLVYQLDRVGLQAVPIISLITVLIGGIIAQQGIFHFRRFGAGDYAVDLVGILVLREIGVLLVAIMVAGRSGSSYTAELGSMKMREEIDALRTMGLDPVEVLLLPRVVALVCALPALAFLGSLAALFGGGLAEWLYGGMSPAIFIARLKDAISITHFEVGIIKAPFMAVVIGVVACCEGLKVKGSAEFAGSSDNHVGRQIDIPRHRAGRPVRHLLRRNRHVAMDQTNPKSVISVRDLVVGFSDHVVLNHLSLDVRRGEILGLVGASGGGKSVLLRTIIGLIAKQAGEIALFGVDTDAASPEAMRTIERRWGILFQQGALFSSLSVRQNVEFPMREYLHLSAELRKEVALTKLGMVGLSAEDAEKFPSELSGGMTKRAALALDPEVVFLDEPTSGLDPIAAGEFNSLIKTLQQTLGLTVFMVTHDLDSLYAVCDRIAVLADGKIVVEGSIAAVLACKHPWVKAYFRGKRTREPAQILGQTTT